MNETDEMVLKCDDWNKIVCELCGDVEISSSNIIEKIKGILVRDYSDTKDYKDWASNKFNVNHKFDGGDMLLHRVLDLDDEYIPHFMKVGLVKIVDALIELNRKSVNIKNDEHETPLLLAIRYDCMDVVKLMVEKRDGDDVFDGDDPLIYSAHFGSIEMIKFFLSLKREMLCMDADNVLGSIIDRNLSFNNEYARIVKSLTESAIKDHNIDGMLIDSLFAASVANNSEALKLMLIAKNAVNINVRDNNESTPLHSASEHSSKEAIAILIENGANHLLKDKKGKTALDVAPSFEIKQFIEECLALQVKRELLIRLYDSKVISDLNPCLEINGNKCGLATSILSILKVLNLQDLNTLFKLNFGNTVYEGIDNMIVKELSSITGKKFDSVEELSSITGDYLDSIVDKLEEHVLKTKDPHPHSLFHGTEINEMDTNIAVNKSRT